MEGRKEGRRNERLNRRRRLPRSPLLCSQIEFQSSLASAAAAASAPASQANYVGCCRAYHRGKNREFLVVHRFTTSPSDRSHVSNANRVHRTLTKEFSPQDNCAARFIITSMVHPACCYPSFGGGQREGERVSESRSVICMMRWKRRGKEWRKRKGKKGKEGRKGGTRSPLLAD